MSSSPSINIWQSTSMKTYTQKKVNLFLYEKLLFWILVDLALLCTLLSNLHRFIIPVSVIFLFTRSGDLSENEDSVFYNSSSWTVFEWILCSLICGMLFLNIIRYQRIKWKIQSMYYKKSESAQSPSANSPSTSTSTHFGDPSSTAANLRTSPTTWHSFNLSRNIPQTSLKMTHSFNLSPNMPQTPLKMMRDFNENSINPSGYEWSSSSTGVRSRFCPYPNELQPAASIMNTSTSGAGVNVVRPLPQVSVLQSSSWQHEVGLDQDQGAPAYVTTNLDNFPPSSTKGYHLATYSPSTNPRAGDSGPMGLSPHSLSGTSSHKTRATLSTGATNGGLVLMQSPEASAVVGEENPASLYWKDNLVTDSRLDLWTVNLRKWIHGSIVKRVLEEIDVINSQSLAVWGSHEAKIGNVSLELLRQVSSQWAAQLPELPVLLKFLDCTREQGYLVNRLRELANGGCLGDYNWNGGSSHSTWTWKEHLPNDTMVLCHLLLCYLDLSTRRYGSSQFASATFSQAHFLPMNVKLDLPESGPVLQEESQQPPHFRVLYVSPSSPSKGGEGKVAVNGGRKLPGATVSGGSETRHVKAPWATAYFVEQGRKNFYHAVLLMFHLALTKDGAQLHGVDMGPCGLNVSWIFDD